MDKGALAQDWLLPAGMGVMWERGELRVGELTLRERCDWSSIQFTVILETSGSCFLREMRRQVTKRKKYYYHWPYEWG